MSFRVLVISPSEDGCMVVVEEVSLSRPPGLSQIWDTVRVEVVIPGVCVCVHVCWGKEL